MRCPRTLFCEGDLDQVEAAQARQIADLVNFLRAETSLMVKLFFFLAECVKPHAP